MKEVWLVTPPIANVPAVDWRLPPVNIQNREKSSQHDVASTRHISSLPPAATLVSSRVSRCPKSRLLG